MSVDCRRMLVTDFDGTLTQRDFYQVYVERLMPPNAPDFWAEYRAGCMTHFDALKEIFAFVPAGEERFLGLASEMQIEPALADALTSLCNAGWDVVVVSAGCRWYIDRLLASAGVHLEVHANLGHVDEAGRLIMERPEGTPYPSLDIGIDKSAVVSTYIEKGWTVAFAGDGPPDFAPAMRVPPHLRFARGHLADALREQGESFRTFARWRDIAEALVAERV
jgi:2,3-diketo-5-methylthio-1-phosphopentane phosphatase